MRAGSGTVLISPDVGPVGFTIVKGDVPGLDATDQQIVALLIADARISTRALAQAIGLPESTARARLRGLIDKDLVGPTIVVHPSVEDHRFVYVTRLTLAEGMVGLPDHPALADAPWVARVATAPTYFVQRAARTFEELVAAIDTVSEIDGIASASHSLFLRLFVGGNWDGQAPTPQGWELNSDRALDAIDRVLIQGLRRDGRASYTALAVTVGLTVVATRKRVLRLVDDQAIRFVTRVRTPVDEQTANLDLQVAPRDLSSVIQRLCSLDCVRYVAEQTGGHNIACHVVAPSTPDLTAAIGHIVQDPQIIAHQVFPFVTVRDELSWVPADPG
ncbi:AsnC family transcriptional regulator [Kineosporia sp. NBRC 101731]|uniref:Lrp/AsnC family transcriptional regulator n=1 Tax=Kineosporia sp. NBRC 101731 TaxID=3032199 RepID=UPI00249FA9CB|nr:AsnC family transcriptional regulator [Kineosporia sp. NBRC 101731]GLY29762.1 AsnC family transcriptional regulator [Kineosporia sp. NBRC 101731]